MNAFSRFNEKYDGGRRVKELDMSTLETYRTQLPPEVFQLLENDGVSSYMDGFLWTLDPTEHVDWLNDWLQFESSCVPFARTAFADIVFVNDGKLWALLSNKGLLDRLTSRPDFFFNRYLTDNGFLEKYFHFGLFGQLEDKSLQSAGGTLVVRDGLLAGVLGNDEPAEQPLRGRWLPRDRTVRALRCLDA